MIRRSCPFTLFLPKQQLHSISPFPRKPIRHISGKKKVEMEAANHLKKVLDEGKRPSMGVWQMIPGSNVSRIMARSGVDWVAVDQEHGNIDG